jgi:hypothetical protein
MANLASDSARIGKGIACFFFLVTALSFLSCNSAPSASTVSKETIPSMDRVSHEDPKDPVNFLRKTFPVKDYEKFEFEILPHSNHPRLSGSFRSFVARSSGATVSDDSANVNLLVLSPDEFAAFTQGNSGNATYSIEGSHERRLDFDFASTSDQPQKYYLVFSNPKGGVQNKFVDADFTLSFD